MTVIASIPERSHTISVSKRMYPNGTVGLVRVNWGSVPGGKSVQRVGYSPVADRERWLDQLSGALDDAHQLLFELDLSSSRAFDAGDLFHRIEAARVEVRSLQLSRSEQTPVEMHPVWMSFSPWQAEAEDGC